MGPPRYGGDDDLPGGPHAGLRRHPPQPPRPPFGPGRGPRTGPDRLLRRLEQLQHRFDTVREVADRFLDRLSQETERDRGGH